MEGITPIDEAAARRLHELRGWSPEAIARLDLGIDRGRVVIPVKGADGELAAVLRYQPNPGKRDGAPKMMASPGAKRALFPAPESLPPDGRLWIVEGEPDAIAAASIGLAATGLPGVQGWDESWAARFKDRDVIVCMDCDRTGREAATTVADSLLHHAHSVRILDLAAGRDDGYDLTDVIMEGLISPESTLALLTQVAELAPPHLALADRPPAPRMSLMNWRRAILDHVEGKQVTPAWPTGFREVDDACDGGIRPGEIWVLAGWTSAGKSVIADQIADSVADAGASVHLYLTEMTSVQRGLRWVSRHTGIPMGDLRRGNLADSLVEKVRKVLGRLPYAATVVNDWSPRQIAADIRATNTNVAIIDLLHGFHYQDERELSGIVDEFAKAATSDIGTNGSALILVAQLNDGQMRDARGVKRPKPGMHSLKGSSWIKQRCDTVVFIWREDDDTGQPQDTGEFWVAKNRNGGFGGLQVRFVPQVMAFERMETY